MVITGAGTGIGKDSMVVVRNVRHNSVFLDTALPYQQRNSHTSYHSIPQSLCFWAVSMRSNAKKVAHEPWTGHV